MNSKRLYFLLCGLIVLFLGAILGSAYEINGILGKQSDKLVTSKASLASLQQQQVELAQSKKDIANYNDLYKISKSIVPQNKDQAETVRQIVKLADDSGITIQNITFPASTLGSAVKVAAPTGESGSASSTPTAAAPTGPSPTLSQLKKVATIPGVYVLELNVASDSTSGASYKQLISFLSSLEQNRLTALVSKISIAPVKSSTGGSASSGQFTFQLSLDIYIKP